MDFHMASNGFLSKFRTDLGGFPLDFHMDSTDFPYIRHKTSNKFKRLLFFLMLFAYT